MLFLDIKKSEYTLLKNIEQNMMNANNLEQVIVNPMHTTLKKITKKRWFKLFPFLSLFRNSISEIE